MPTNTQPNTQPADTGTTHASKVLAKLAATNAHPYVVCAAKVASAMPKGHTCTFADMGRTVAAKLGVRGNRPHVTVGKLLRQVPRDTGNGARANGQGTYPALTGPQWLTLLATGSMAAALRTQGDAGKAQAANAQVGKVLANARTAAARRAANGAQAGTPQA